jgi:hypothetical protein
MSNVYRFSPPNSAVDPDIVLCKAAGVYESVVVIGWDKFGEVDVRGSLNLTSAEILWMLEEFKHQLFSGVYEESGQ